MVYCFNNTSRNSLNSYTLLSFHPMSSKIFILDKANYVLCSCFAKPLKHSWTMMREDCHNTTQHNREDCPCYTLMIIDFSPAGFIWAVHGLPLRRYFFQLLIFLAPPCIPSNPPKPSPWLSVITRPLLHKDNRSNPRCSLPTSKHSDSTSSVLCIPVTQARNCILGSPVQALHFIAIIIM